ncbi:hypothetical protein ABIE26_003650 [Pedobacter africanus]|uniref:Uncharacterized protein n=1 Tax=Pedobacter africanus TaxID=151894 RepID=A0ACC6L0J9_9SPHI|nr:hypothetical protein [Pedobacter africanus]MDR6784952.1 hypothetical protein [Pedobacter africanus]
MKTIIRLKIATALLVLMQQVNAQECVSSKDLEGLPGKQIDVAHFEFPQQKANWFNGLGTTANKTMANTVLTKIETLEKQSRSKYNLTGCVLKTSFSANKPTIIANQYQLASYDLNLGCYEYICVKNKMMVNSEYANVFRAHVNRYTGIEPAYSFANDNYFYETPMKYNGQFIALCNFIKMDGLKNINNGKGFYQDIDEATVKQGNRGVFMTRHWYLTKPNALLFVPVTRKEYLEALLVYYEREGLMIADKIKEIEKQAAGMMKNPQKYPELYESGKRSLVAGKAKYPDWQQKIETKKAIVQKALKENTMAWFAEPAVVKPKTERFSWKNNFGPGSNDNSTVEVFNADSKEDAQKTGSFTFSGFWDTKGGTTLYKYNPNYFKGAEKDQAKPYMIELTYRYIKTPLGQSLVENFTENFDFDAVRNILE